MAQHSEAVSSGTSYMAGVLVFLSSQSLETWTAALALLLVVVRLLGDIPTTITKWREYVKGKRNDEDSAD